MPNLVSCRKAFTGTLETLAAADDSLFMVCTDSRGSVTAAEFARRFPRQFVEVGIAEQNAVGVAAGLAAAGKNVFAAGPACFLTSRSYEQIKVDIAYNKLSVKIVGVSAGVSYGPLGGTHTSLHDFAGLRALPNIEIFAPSDAAQTAAITQYLAKSRQPAYMRTGRGDVAEIYSEDEIFDVHKAKQLHSGDDVTLIACGEMVQPALAAARLLAEKGVAARVLDMFCLKPADTAAIRKAAAETKCIVTIEEHSVHGGLGELVCGAVAAHNPVPVKIMGFPDEECKVGSSGDLFRYYNLTADGIAAECERLVKKWT